MNTIEIVSLIINLAVMLFGLPGNAIIIAVYGRKKTKKSTDTLILSQAILDFMGGVLALVDIMRTSLDPVKSDALCKFTICSLRIVAYSSLYLTSAIAVDRCVLIKRPFDRRTSPRKAYIGVLFSIIFAGISQSYNFVYVELADFGVCVRRGVPAAIERAVSILSTVSFVTTLLLAVICYSIIYATIRSQARVRAALMEIPQPATPAVVNTGTSCHVSTPNNPNAAHQSTRGHNPIMERPEGNLKVPEFHHKNLHDRINEINTIASPEATIRSQETAFVASDANCANAPQPPPRAPAARPRGDHKTTQMLLFTTIILIILWLPNTVLNHVPSDDLTRLQGQSPAKSALVYSCFAIRTLNHIINIYVYLLVNKRFREDCKKLLWEKQ